MSALRCTLLCVLYLGTQWYMVEQDVCRHPPIESLKISFNNLKTVLGE